MVPLPFSKDEYRQRLRRLRDQMARRGIDLLIVTDVANQYYLTAYDGWSFYTPQIVVVPIEDEEPYWLGRGIDAIGGKLTIWMSPDHSMGFPDHYVQQNDRHPMDWMADWIKGKGWGSRRIGIETETYYYSPRAHAHLVKGLPNAAISEANLLVAWLRAVKSPAEIEYMRKAARLVEAAMRAAYDSIATGVRECDSVPPIYRAQLSSQEGWAGDATAIPPTILAGDNSAAPHMLWTDRKYGETETIALELAGACRHYTAGLARTMHLGKPAKKLKDAGKAVLEGMDAVLDMMKPGVTGEEVELTYRTTIAKYGLKKESRCGYSIGIGYPPDWGEHTISLRSGDKSVLEPGNTIHVMLGMWFEGWGMEVSETVLVTPKGNECITEFPREVFYK
jgi:Xaa-Pro dipeptidase